ncbi:MAG: FtsW/RodA/SpoVE family cell cycle protein [Planctomycetota bacterium]|jgi:rod shape determining protein RodA
MRESLRLYFRHTSLPIIAATLALIAIGVAAIRFSGVLDERFAHQWTKQATFAVIGLLVFVAATIVPYQRIGRFAYVIFALTLVLLVGVLFTQPIKNATRWIDLGLIKVQPSEIAKLAYILMLAWYLRFGDHYRRFVGFIFPFVLTFVPMGLILYEPDLGTGLLFLPTLYFMLFMAGAKLRHLLLIVALGLVVVLAPAPKAVDAEAFEAEKDRFVTTQVGPVRFYSVDESLPWSRRPRTPIAYCRLQISEGGIYDIQPLSLRVLRPGGHQIRRVEGWLRQEDPSVAWKEGYQLRWSLVTLAAGRWFGYMRSGDSEDLSGELLPLAIRRLPEDHTDFIFSVIGGQWGFVGSLVVLALYAVIFVFGIEIATITYDPFGRLLAVGVLGLLLSQLFINIAMTMGLLPITGMTLPLISYGGSSLVVNCASLGLLVNVGQRRPILLSPHPFEHGEKKEKQVNIESRRKPRGDEGKNTWKKRGDE